ncbi:glycosyl transferase [Candidatus Woesearchaeota archaeon CG10_big_fil_rev_8_21_14_0_10_44_13]|nr:MAG: glycosyl transferase [Candidatus Woesearchaeota archaeon CG10_big_fil_rev_8_21_14_0_10_44_13]
MPELSIVALFYNEQENAGKVVSDLSASLKDASVDYEIIAVNNGSNDRTPQILEAIRNSEGKRMRIVTIKKNIGYGNGVIQGLKSAKGKYVGYMWGDNEISSGAVVMLYDELKKGNCDLCKITRVSRNYSLMRKIQSRFYNMLFYMMFSVNSKDINGCPKIMKKECYLKINPQSKDWFVDAEIMINAKRNNYGVKELPVEYRKREGGQSHVRWTTTFEFLKNMLHYKLKGV